ncbi:MAG: FkbM family methyltransferase [Magnetovibrio sp.]|nr:FkbM family methyltransferase [Magnetovibrio sp.]
MHQILCANVALNGLENVRARHAALGAEPGQIIVPGIDYEKGGNYGGLELGKYEQGERVAVETIDALNLKACHFIKIDVEGMENEVLDGAADTLARHQPVLYVENDRRERAAELIERLMRAEYRLFWHLPPLFNPDNHFGNPENVFGGLLSRNMFCLPKGSPLNVTNFTEITSPDETF